MAKLTVEIVTPEKRILSVQADALSDDTCRQHPSTERFDRVITGLGRQLRAPLTRDVDQGRFSVEISAHE